MQNLGARLWMTFTFILTFCLLEISSSAEWTIINVVNDTNACAEEDSCFTLNELVANNKHVIRSNTKIILSSTSHSLNSFGIVLITYVSNLTLATDSDEQGIQTLINCNGTTGFLFHSVHNLTIFGISFKNCGANPSHYLPPTLPLHSCYTVLILNHPFNVSITRLSISDNQDCGVSVFEPGGYFILVNSSIQGNSEGISFYSFSSSNSLQSTNYDLSNLVFHSRLDQCVGMRMELEQTDTNVAIQMSDIHVYQCKINIIYNVCKTSGNLQRLVFVRGECTLNPDTSFALLNGVTFTKWNMFNMSDVTFNGTVVEVQKIPPHHFSSSENKRVRYRIALTNTVFRGISRLYFADVYQILMYNTSFLENHGTVSFVSLTLVIEGYFRFTRNYGGIAVMSDLLKWDIQSNVTVCNNSDISFNDNVISDSDSSAPLHVIDSSIDVYQNSTIAFERNYSPQCGGLLLEKSIITLHSGNISLLFSDNEGGTGGAMALYGASQVKDSFSFTKMQFIRNHAQEVGGAIYIHDFSVMHLSNGIGYNYKPFLDIEMGSDLIVDLSFTNNSAQLGGNTLYGGWVDSNIYFYNLPLYEEKKPFSELKNTVDNPSVISSDPVRVCPCTESVPNCSIAVEQAEIFPGQTVVMEAVAVGQRYGIVPATVLVQLQNNSDPELRSKLDDTQYVQSVGIQCTNLTFTLRSPIQFQSILLTSYNRFTKTRTLYSTVWVYGYDTLFDQLVLHVHLKRCPLGIYFNTSSKECSCLTVLTDNKVACDFSAYQVLRPAPKWINATSIPSNSSRQVTMITVHNHCPFDYCIVTDEPVALNLEFPDRQCAFNRSGILCGACRPNLSNVLGTSKCSECTKPWVVLIVPLIALAGIALVACLIFLNVTVSLGTINGLIFYANIVRANHALFFKSNSFFSYFVAWLNLDIGFETCFYNGFDSIAKTWLQFLFPLYIWLMVTAIIVASHYSTIASRLSGNNAVQVLATLFLLSYAKLLRIIITIFSATELIYSDNTTQLVWLYDGNVDYLKGEHIPLFLAGLVLLIFLTVPYTTVLFSIQWLLRWSSYKIFFWVQKLHPFFDAYCGPYKIKHRYWTGLLLLVRVGLFLIFSVNTLGDPTINFLAISVVVLCLLAYLSLIGGTYKQWLLNVLEMSFILNLGILSGAVGLYQNDTKRVAQITKTSVIIAFALFVVIIFYHLIIALTFKRGQILIDYVKRKFHKDEEEDIIDTPLTQPTPPASASSAVTQSVVAFSSLSKDDINEPLLTTTV